MSHVTSPSTQARYGVARARSSFYAARDRLLNPRQAGKCGPKVLSDSDLLSEIQKLLVAPMFPGEGYRKIWARLRFAEVRTSKERVLRLIRSTVPEHAVSVLRHNRMNCCSSRLDLP